MDLVARLAALRTEFETDPTEQGYAPHLETGADNQLAALINARVIPARRLVTREALFAQVDTLGVWLAVRTALADPETPAPLRVACEMVVDVRNAPYPTVNLDLPMVTQMLDALADGSLLSVEQRAVILALADAFVSRAELVWAESGVYVSDAEIAVALRGNPDGE